MTPYQDIFDAFLSKILDDEWETWTQTERDNDLITLLNGAIPYFKFPRVNLETRNDTTKQFTENLTNAEIQILATYMKVEWLNRTILTWENIRPLYDEKDFSQANLIDKFIKLQEREEKKAHKLESLYYRSVNGRAYEYSKLSG